MSGRDMLLAPNRFGCSRQRRSLPASPADRGGRQQASSEHSAAIACGSGAAHARRGRRGLLLPPAGYEASSPPRMPPLGRCGLSGPPSETLSRVAQRPRGTKPLPICCDLECGRPRDLRVMSCTMCGPRSRVGSHEALVPRLAAFTGKALLRRERARVNLPPFDRLVAARSRQDRRSCAGELPP
jgi:hypothetical protein